MRINANNLKKVVESHYTTKINSHFGTNGLDTLRDLLTGISEIYKYLALEVIRGPIIVYADVGENSTVENNFQLIQHVSQLTQIVGDSFSIKLKDNGQILFFNGIPTDLNTLSQKSLIYIYEEETEYFLVNGAKNIIPRLIDNFPSAFAIPTFSELEEALEHYKMSMVRYSSCKILSNIWNDSKRIFLRSGPEHIMRDSLTQYLKSCLRGDVEVRPEQIVDESHPVDIKITWLFTNRLALIEIKWLGKSIGKNGTISNNHTDYRALQGAKQLNDYLDSNKVQSPTQITKGYLVLIDARRKGIDVGTSSIDSINGNYYLNQEIEYNPKYHELRGDFSLPFRMFIEPICG